MDSLVLYQGKDITREALYNSLPPNLRKITSVPILTSVTEALNKSPELRQHLNVSLKMVQTSGETIPLNDLMHATLFVSLMLAGSDALDAWKTTFPGEYKKALDAGDTKGVLKYRANRYANSPIIVRLMEQSIVPSWIRHHSAYTEAVLTQVDLMRNAASETVKQKAADSLMTHLAKPSIGVPQVQVNVGETSGLTAIKEMLDSLSIQQQKSIVSGTSVKEIAEMEITDID